MRSYVEVSQVSTNDRKRNGKNRVSEKEEIEEEEEENEERNSTALHQGHSRLPRLACYFYHGGIDASLGGRKSLRIFAMSSIHSIMLAGLTADDLNRRD